MAGLTACTLVYARTGDGVTKVQPGEVLPDGVTEAEVERLLGVGAVKPQDEAAPEPTPGAAGRGKAKGAES